VRTHIYMYICTHVRKSCTRIQQTEFNYIQHNKSRKDPFYFVFAVSILGRIKNVYFPKICRPKIGSNKLQNEWVLAALCGGVKRPQRETNHLPKSSAEVKTTRSYKPSATCAFMAGTESASRNKQTPSREKASCLTLGVPTKCNDCARQ
jgi:hypothetical protein